MEPDTRKGVTGVTRNPKGSIAFLQDEAQGDGMRMCAGFLGWFAGAACGFSTAQTVVSTEPAPISQAEVRLEAHQGKTQFLLGDVIRLDLVFQDVAFPDRRAEVPKNKAYMPVRGQRTVNSIDYNDLADEVTITPSTGWFKWQGKSGHDYMSSEPLDATGIRMDLVLNQGYVFHEPGHYEIAVTTWRMSAEGDYVARARTTNTVGIDIAARPVDEEEALVRSLDAEIAGSKGKARKRAAEGLSYLTGDAAARAKVKWLLAGNGDVSNQMSEGLASTRDQTLQLGLLKAAWDDPKRAPDGTLQYALGRAERFAQGKAEPGLVMWGPAEKPDAVTSALAAESRDDVQRVIASLPQRTGLVRRDTTYYLMENNKLSAEQIAAVKPILLEEIPAMEPMAKSMLIETRWDAVKDASWAPVLKEMIDGNEQWSDAATALQRLIEVDEPDSRPYVVKMVCSSKRGLLLDKLIGVKADRLPEVDDCLAAMLSKSEERPHDFNWEQAAQRAARFATPKILPAIKEGWKDSSQDASMLAVLLRDAPDEAADLLKEKPAVDLYPTNKVYETLHEPLPAQMLSIMRAQLKENGDRPGTAAYELASFGEAPDRKLIEDHLLKLRADWRGRQAEMKDAVPNTDAYRAKSEEQNLVSALVNAKAWKVTEEDRVRVTADCVSDWCQRYAPKKLAQSANESQ